MAAAARARLEKASGLTMHPPKLLLGPMDAEAQRAATAFGDLFPQVYLLFHLRRDPTLPRLTNEMWSILQHLALSGPLTVTEAARHFDRAQSVVSDTVTALEKKGLLERLRDSRDRRRTLVWLTEEGLSTMARHRRVLDEARLRKAMAGLPPGTRDALVAGLQALVLAGRRAAAQTNSVSPPKPKPTRPPRKKTP